MIIDRFGLSQEDRLMEYMKNLLAEGEEVLRSRIPSRSRLIVDLVDSSKYNKWVMNCITFLEEDAPVHAMRIKEIYIPQYCIFNHAEQILAIVASAGEYLEHKYTQKERESKVQKEPAEIFNLDHFHPKLKEKCADHFVSKKFDDAILNACKVVEVHTRDLANLKETDIGINLMMKAFNPDKPILKYSDVKGEQEALMFLFAGFIGVFKNPQSHRFIDIKDPAVAFEVLNFAKQLCRILEQTKTI